MTGSILTLVFIFFVILTVAKGVRMVPQGFEYTVERFGKYTHTLKPGLALLVPYVYSVGRKINMMFQVLDAAKAAYEVSNLEQATIALVMTNIRTAIGSMDLDESLSKRDEINSRLLKVVDEATAPWGVKVNRIELKDIQPPQNLIDSMARQMKAEREKRAAILEAEGLRSAEILRAEGEKQAAVLEAEGRREAAFRDAEARERLAEAEARATMMVSQAIAKGDMQAINYFIADKYVQALKAFATAPNQKLLLMPLETTGVLGSLAGIAEIAKSALEKDAPAKVSPPRPRDQA